MKKMIKAVLMATVLFLVSCSDGQSAKAVTVTSQQDVSEVIADLAAKQEAEYEAEKAEEEAQAEAEPTAEPEKDPAVKLMAYNGKIDVDLTRMNSTMIYSEVFNMMMQPEEYIGKIVRIYGMYTHYYEESNDEHYYACVVQDATACCAQGLEFVLNDSYQWPDDYPVDGDEVVVTGVFTVYQDSYFRVLQLENAVIEDYTPRVEG